MTVPAQKVGVVGFEQDAQAATRLAQALTCDFGMIERHTFPDGESLVRAPECPETVVLYAALDRPNAKIFDLCLAVDALRRRGVRRIVLVVPYLPYMRQDKAFHSGEAVSQQVLGALLAGRIDGLVTVDPHLHRVNDLQEVFTGLKTAAVSAAPLVAQAVKTRLDSGRAVVIGPDEESTPLVRLLGEAAGCAWMAGTKRRSGDRQVELTLPDEPKLACRTAVIFDDVVSSGTTVCAVAQAAKDAGAAEILVYTTHALFSGEDEARMRDAGVASFVSCDGVPHATNGIALAPVLAEAVQSCL
jgi:ribose-phosphate pyrophosphokinase